MVGDEQYCYQQAIPITAGQGLPWIRYSPCWAQCWVLRSFGMLVRPSSSKHTAFPFNLVFEEENIYYFHLIFLGSMSCCLSSQVPLDLFFWDRIWQRSWTKTHQTSQRRCKNVVKRGVLAQTTPGNSPTAAWRPEVAIDSSSTWSARTWHGWSHGCQWNEWRRMAKI